MTRILLEKTVLSVYDQVYERSIKRFFFKKDKSFRRIAILTDIDFSASSGDRVGILGLNGAGKTTFLKLVAGIYTPVAGNVLVDGKITAVMASGLGLDGEYEVYNNIKLGLAYTGSLHLYSRKLEKRILEFAELTDRRESLFKTLSTGYQARLAFSIVLNQWAEILLVDEILATGDAKFVHKSQKAMLENIEKSSITLFATHNPAMVKEICNRCVVLDNGRIVFDGGVEAGVDYYQEIVAS